MPRGQEQLAWSQVAAILCLSRFCRPSSELSIAEKFYPHSGLQELLDISPEQVNEDRLYRGLGEAPRRLLEEMQSIQSGEVMLPIRHTDGSVDQTLVIRYVIGPLGGAS